MYNYGRPSLNEMMLMVCFIQQGMYSCCPTLCNTVAHAQRVPQSGARAGRLRFRVVYSASVILDSDTHIECLLCIRQDCLSNMCECVTDEYVTIACVSDVVDG